ncbi:MAG: hypothetical protein MZV70_70035 [Desulfobacterales bacterium]|nr:hypothetical protein [Desulfobacterales bacterium]
MFDGAHLGHQSVIKNAVNKAKELNNISAVVTFANHPQIITNKKHPKLITTLDKKLELIEELGVQAALVLDFTEDLSQMSATIILKIF